jgi:hypothetical protein
MYAARAAVVTQTIRREKCRATLWLQSKRHCAFYAKMRPHKVGPNCRRSAGPATDAAEQLFAEQKEGERG